MTEETMKTLGLLDSIAEKRKRQDQGILDEYKKTGYAKENSPNIGKTILGIGKAALGAGAMFVPGMQGVGAGMIGGGVGDTVDALGETKTNNYFTGESIQDPGSDAMGKAGQNLGDAMSMDKLNNPNDPLSGKKRKMFWEQ